MRTLDIPRFAAFDGYRLVARGDLHAVAQAAQAHQGRALLILDEATGQTVDLDLRRSAADVSPGVAEPSLERKTRGRPRLGVVAREVTLLPRHWDWLTGQPGGASAALRRLVDHARRANQNTDDLRRLKDRTYRAMTALAGDLPGYEEVLRAMFADDIPRAQRLMQSWPEDVRVVLQDVASANPPPSQAR